MVEGLIERAHARAQRRLRAMVVAKVYGDPLAVETRLYTQAERLVDNLLIDAAWEQVKAELDAKIMADLEADDLSLGDHFMYPDDFNVEGQPELNGAFR